MLAANIAPVYTGREGNRVSVAIRSGSNGSDKRIGARIGLCSTPRWENAR